MLLIEYDSYQEINRIFLYSESSHSPLFVFDLHYQNGHGENYCDQVG